MLAALLSQLISQCFFAVYETIIDTIFLCFCEDCETNDGLSRPYFMPRSLMQFVHNSSKKTVDVKPPVEIKTVREKNDTSTV